jgi:hypothetical protein
MGPAVQINVAEEQVNTMPEVVSSEVCAADELPGPTAAERKPPKVEVDTGQARLH